MNSYVFAEKATRLPVINSYVFAEKATRLPVMNSYVFAEKATRLPVIQCIQSLPFRFLTGRLLLCPQLVRSKCLLRFVIVIEHFIIPAKVQISCRHRDVVRRSYDFGDDLAV